MNDAAANAAAVPGQLRVGTSGFLYDHWQGVFYPADLPKARRFPFYATQFSSVEINATFYRLPAAAVFDGWREKAPPGFTYALKFSRFCTHIKRLLAVAEPTREFVARARRLGPALGPILVQLPPHWHADPGRLREFLAAAPTDLRWAFEFRDPDWLRDEVFALLRAHNAALCIHDLLPHYPRLLTADWTYLRFHGEHYGGSYSEADLRPAADWLRGQLAAGHDAFAYFNNDADGFAAPNAALLRRLATG
ncbi:MAG: DUF72 domain-containing protein [Lentisphaeria bacterium]|jgi:uncharacterized protein YecE (DUF72 family)